MYASKKDDPTQSDITQTPSAFQRVHRQPVPSVTPEEKLPSTRAQTRTVEIKISLPNVNLPSVGRYIPWEKITRTPGYQKSKSLISKVPRRHLLRVGGAVCAIALVSMTSNYLRSSQDTTQATDIPRSSAPQLTRGTPDYDTVLPAGKSIEQLGGWTRISPPDRNPVFAYVDKIGNSPINVSQQPLPKDMEADSAKGLEELAQNFKANQKITVGTTTVYIGTSAEGPQSVIFNKNDLLILIKSTVPVESNDWAEYINSLQ